jgi:peptide/nickel transport system substrate-binding protein/oligopeptide transport system substrate-binding protein
MHTRIRTLSLSGLIAFLGLLAIIVAGCGSGSNGGVRPDAQQILRYPLDAASSDIKTMDPALNQDFYSYYPISLVFPGLMTLDANGTPQPWAAASAPTFDQTANTYTFKVRSGLKWSDGTPIDANTFAYSINRSLSPCTGSLVTYYLFPIKNAQAFSTEKCGTDGVSVVGPIKSLIGDSLLVPDNQTLVIKLGAPAPYFLQALCYPTAMAQPQELINQYGIKDWTNHLVGFGGNLFNVKLWDHKGHIDLVRNDGFWGAKPKLREVDFTVYKTTAALYADYLDGRLDEGRSPADQYKQSKARSDFHEVPYLGIGYYQPNWAKAPFNNLDARQAFAEAIDKQIIADNVLQGADVPTYHIVPQGMYGYDPNLVGPDGTTSVSGNVTAAKAAMAKYVAEACGGKITTCTPVTLYDTNDPVTQTEDQAVVAMWQNAFPGYPINTQFLDFNSLLTLIYSANAPQIFGIGWSADYPDPQDWLSLQFAPGSINNTGNVNVPAANTLMAQADTNLDPTSRAQEYNQAEQLLVTDVAWISMYQEKTRYNLPTYVHNFAFDSLATIPLATWQSIYLTQ